MLKRVVYSSMFVFWIILLVLSFKLGLMKMHSKNKDDGEKKYSHHIQVITYEKDNKFYKNLKQGIDRASEEFNILVEMIYVEKDDTQLFQATFERAMRSGTDGIAFQSVDGVDMKAMLQEASNRGINVVTFENGRSEIGKIPLIGANNYNKGKQLAQMALTSCVADRKKMLVFLDNSETSSIIAQGIKSVVTSPEDVSFCNITGSKFDMIKKTKKELASHKKDKINCILCANEEYTNIIGQNIIDNNEVGQKTIVGYGNSDETCKMIKDGVISGTLCPNGYEIGTQIVRQLNNGIQSKNTSSVSTMLYELTKDKLNVDSLELEKMYFEREQ